MAVYVDDMYRYKMGRYRGMKMSHMIADTETELHAMAKKLGVRKWFQDGGSGDHYDICLSKRSEAVKMGAIEVTLRQLSAMNMMRRLSGKLPTPEEAEQMLAERMSKGAKSNGQGKGAETQDSKTRIRRRF